MQKNTILEKVLFVSVLFILLAGCSGSGGSAGAETDTATGTVKTATCETPRTVGTMASALDLAIPIGLTSNIAENTSIIHLPLNDMIQEFCDQANPAQDFVLQVMDPSKGLIAVTMAITDVSIDPNNSKQVNISVKGPVAQGSLLTFKNIRLPEQVIGGPLSLEGAQFMTTDAAALSFPVTGKSKPNLYLPGVYGGEMFATIPQTDDPDAAFALMDNQLAALVTAGFVTPEKKTELEALFHDATAREVFTNDDTSEFAAFAMAAVLASGNVDAVNDIRSNPTASGNLVKYIYDNEGLLTGGVIAGVWITVDGNEFVLMDRSQILSESFAVISGLLASHEPLHFHSPVAENPPVGRPEESIAELIQNKNWGQQILAQGEQLFSQGNTLGTDSRNFQLTLQRNSGSGKFNGRRVPGLNEASWKNALPDSNVPNRSTSWGNDLKFFFPNTPDISTEGNPLLSTLLSQREGIQVPSNGFNFDRPTTQAIENSEGFTPLEWTEIGQTLGWELVLDPKAADVLG